MMKRNDVLTDALIDLADYTNETASINGNNFSHVALHKFIKPEVIRPKLQSSFCVHIIQT